MKRTDEFVRITLNAVRHAVVVYFRPVVWAWQLIPRVLSRALAPQPPAPGEQPIPEMVAELVGVIAELNGHIARHFSDVAPIELPPAAVMEAAERNQPGCVSEYFWAMSFLLTSLKLNELRDRLKAREARALLRFATAGFTSRLKSA